MIRTLDATGFNEAANHPEVRLWLGGEGALDLKDVVGSIANYALQFEGGGFIAVNSGGGIYEVHTIFTPDHRGADAVEAAKEAFEYMFLRTDCTELVTRVPCNNRQAAAFAKVNGFVKRFSRANAWTSGGIVCDVDYYGIHIEQWAMRSEACEAAGHTFHKALEAAKVNAGSNTDIHDDDQAHDKAAGAAYRMISAGNAEKGVTFYNRWAVLAGYVPIELLSQNPAVVDIRDAVLEARDGQMEVLLCR